MRLFAGDAHVDAWPWDARATAYGDGLFETMLVHAGAIPWWEAHWSRLASGAMRLRMRLPDEEQVRREADTLFQDAGDGVLKLLVSRGAMARGYSPSASAAPAWMLARFPLPAWDRDGLRVRWCETRLAVQPTLAGIKHCNRLEQVLARAECDAAGADEGLLRDTSGDVVGAVSANVFVLHGEQWTTPPVDRCGVAGVCRARLLVALDAREDRLSMDEVERAEAVFLCNAVRGILPLVELGARRWPSHPAIAAARGILAAMHPGFADDQTPATEPS
ncbi:MAG: aminodeoxychorismate lyase [Luteimonas sp.]